MRLNIEQIFELFLHMQLKLRSLERDLFKLFDYQMI